MVHRFRPRYKAAILVQIARLVVSDLKLLSTYINMKKRMFQRNIFLPVKLKKKMKRRKKLRIQ